MCLILNIDCSRNNMFVGLTLNGLLIATKTIEEKKNHATYLNVFVAEIMHEANYTMNQLQAVAVLNGPGSYTGLRIALAAAKGFCFALNIPLICINYFEMIGAMVLELNNNENKFLIGYEPMVGELILCAFDQILKTPYIINLTDVPIQNQELTIYSTALSQDAMNTLGCKKIILAYNNDTWCKNAFYKYKQNIFENLVEIIPLYIKPTFINVKKPST
jgi:tRNA threonylcarbamoyl adenosine modification protein YeaZ